MFRRYIGGQSDRKEETPRRFFRDKHEPSLSNQLFRLIEKGKWDKVRKFLKTHRYLVSTTNDSSGLTPLALAVSAANCPPSIIQAILDADPEAPMRVDDFGATPLHLACLNGTTPNVVKIIQNHELKFKNKAGMSIRQLDHDNYSVLHHAVEYVCLLIDKRYSLHSQNSVESVSDTIVSEHEDYLEIIKILCSTAPEMVHCMTNDNGDSPLDIPQIILAKRKTIGREHQKRLLEVYQLLRSTSLHVYREKKKYWEDDKVRNKLRDMEMDDVNCGKSLPSLESSHASSAFTSLKSSPSLQHNSHFSAADVDEDHMSFGST